MLYEILRLVRVFHDLKAIDLAKRLDISPGYLSEIERGKKQPPISLIKKYGEIFNLPPSSFLYFEERLAEDKGKANFKSIIRGYILEVLQRIETEALSQDDKEHGSRVRSKNRKAGHVLPRPSGT